MSKQQRGVEFARGLSALPHRILRRLWSILEAPIRVYAQWRRWVSLIFIHSIYLFIFSTYHSFIYSSVIYALIFSIHSFSILHSFTFHPTINLIAKQHSSKIIVLISTQMNIKINLSIHPFIYSFFHSFIQFMYSFISYCLNHQLYNS